MTTETALSAEIQGRLKRLQTLLDYLAEGDDGTRPDRDFMPRTLNAAREELHKLEAAFRLGHSTSGWRDKIEGLRAQFEEWRIYSEAELQRPKMPKIYKHGRSAEVCTLSACIAEVDSLLAPPASSEGDPTP
jgi:hypothetical protein